MSSFRENLVDSEEEELVQEFEHLAIQPYQFEPRRPANVDRPRRPQQAAENINRVGNTNW